VSASASLNSCTYAFNPSSAATEAGLSPLLFSHLLNVLGGMPIFAAIVF